MNMRWGWTLPVLSVLATGAVVAPARAQNGAMAPQAAMPANFPPQAMPQPVGPAMPGGTHRTATFLVPAYPSAATYPQAPMYPVMPAAYMAGAEGMQPPAQLPAGPMPDVYGSYGYAPTASGAGGYGAGGLGAGGYGAGFGAP